jgi:endonuclease YncB( thermonuclease family)
MKKLFLLFLMALMPMAVFAAKEKDGKTYDAVITRVIDGDTVAFEAKWLLEPLKPELSVRVFGVDTPEKGHRALCPSEAKRGEEASAFTKKLIKEGKKFQVVLMGWDKYGGRVLGDVLIDGKSLRKQLIEGGFAREYFGDKKESWCK